MRRLLVFFVSLAAAFLGMVAFWACLDVTPIVVTRDAFVPDAGCLACLDTPEGCLEVINACTDDPRCKPAYDCMLVQGCLDLRTIDDKIKCGLPCAQEAGIESLGDPVISTHLVGLVACAQAKCAEPCNLQDASIGF